MTDADLPVDLLRWSLAILPIGVLVFLLTVRSWKAPQAGPVALAVAVASAALAFGTPSDTLAISMGKGVWDAVFILLVIWPALLLYRVIDNAGGFEALRKGVLLFSRNEAFLVLGFSWVFASFLQGITGFGTPIAVVAPLLVAIGVRPVYAVALPLIGHAWANLFGTLAVAWLGTQAVVDLQDASATAIETALLLIVPNLLAGVAIAWLFGRGAALRHTWPMILIITTIHGGGQLALAAWNPVLAAFVASTAAVLVLYPLSHWKRFSEETEAIDTRPAMVDGEHHDDEDDLQPVMSFGMALVPYVVLTVLAVGAVAIGPIESVLGSAEVGVPFPAATTDLGVVNEAEASYNAFAPLTHPGTFLLLAAIVAWLLYRWKRYYQDWCDAPTPEGTDRDVEPIGRGVASDAVPASLAVVAFIVLSQVMDHAGQTEVLALGISQVAPPAVYAFFAGWLGIFGAFTTSSTTSSNIILAPLQQSLAEAEGLREPAVMAGQQAGAAVGNAISPANIVLGTGAAGTVGDEGQVLRKTLPYVVTSAIAIGLGTLVIL